jgi:hypothetical protein
VLSDGGGALLKGAVFYWRGRGSTEGDGVLLEGVGSSDSSAKGDGALLKRVGSPDEGGGTILKGTVLYCIARDSSKHLRCG